MVTKNLSTRSQRGKGKGKALTINLVRIKMYDTAILQHYTDRKHRNDSNDPTKRPPFPSLNTSKTRLLAFVTYTKVLRITISKLTEVLSQSAIGTLKNQCRKWKGRKGDLKEWGWLSGVTFNIALNDFRHATLGCLFTPKLPILIYRWVLSCIIHGPI